MSDPSVHAGQKRMYTNAMENHESPRVSQYTVYEYWYEFRNANPTTEECARYVPNKISRDSENFIIEFILP